MATMTLRRWQTGALCDPHGRKWCSDCYGTFRVTRGWTDGDCAVESFRELTGVEYADAARVLRSVGYRPADGTPRTHILEALAANRYGTRRVSIRIEDAPALTTAGRRFLVSGWTPTEGHSWTISHGRANRPLTPPFRYMIWEVFG